MPELDRGVLEELLELAHRVVSGTDQDVLRPKAAYYRHIVKARQDYLRARISALAEVRPLTSRDTLGCTCNAHTRARSVVACTTDAHEPDFENCMYHLGASLQPWNHRIPWNCPTFYDGCNCEGGPFVERPA